MRDSMTEKTSLRHLMRSVHFLCIAICAAVLSLPALAQDDEAVEDFVAFLDNTVRSIHAQSDAGSTQYHAHCHALMDRILDVDTMARSAVGAIWDRMTAQQRSSYRSAFEARISSECVRSMRAFRSQKVLLAGVRQSNGGDRMLTTGFVLENELERMVTWRLRGATQPLRAVDIIADGRSAVATARNEFLAVLESNNGNVDALIASMQR